MHTAASVALCRRCVEREGVKLAPQVGLGSDHRIDSIGTHWFDCNLSNGFGQKWSLWTTKLSHVTDLKLREIASAVAEETQSLADCWSSG
jgi:hypothetical protein